MDSAEILMYIKKNGMEYQALNMVMYNDIGFQFIPIENPNIEMVEYGFFLFAKRHNILYSGNEHYAFPCCEEMMGRHFIKCLRNMNKNPQHVYAYIARLGNNIWSYYLYEPKADAVETLRERVIRDFIELTDILSIEELHKRIEKAFVIRERDYCIDNKKIDFLTNRVKFSSPQLLLDDKLQSSMKKTEKIDMGLWEIQTKKKFVEAEKAIFEERILPVDLGLIPVLDAKTNFIKGLSVEMEILPPNRIKTDLNSEFVVIDRRDSISDLIYNIIIKLGAKKITFYAATGYAYDSGLNLLESIYQHLSMKSISMSGESETELIIGALEKYNGKDTIKELNRKTAEKINYFIESNYIDGVYTYPNSFYHGKYYYLSNGEESYVIVGSSNITEAAYNKNFELDVLYRFERKDGKISENEKQFIKWYDDLKKQCVKFEALNTELFPNNRNYDEFGSARKETLKRVITEPDEVARYDFLMNHSPAKVDEMFLLNAREMRPFKGYIAFIYTNYNMIVLESFKAGNASYCFGTSKLKEVKETIRGCTKAEVQKSQLLLDHIEHYDNYEQRFEELFFVRQKHNE